MRIINKNTVLVSTFQELSISLTENNSYNYIYLENDITLEDGIIINENKENIIINGTYNNLRHKITGLNSNDQAKTISATANTKKVEVRNIDIEYINTYGVIYVPVSLLGIIVIYANVNFNGTQLSYNPYGTTKITDSIINIKDMGEVLGEEVCESDQVIIGGETTITSSSVNNALFTFRNNTLNPSIIFLCQSDINLSSDTKELMQGTNKVNFTILHDTKVYLKTGNGFAGYTIHGANNVLIDERATLIFIENKHQRIPMWSIFGNFTMKENSTLQLINSYNNTPSDNYNLHFKGASPKITLDNPKEVVIYSKNANVIYTNNPLEFDLKCTRINLWNNSTELVSAGGIDNLPDYYWYKSTDLLKISGTITSSMTAITNHNISTTELAELSDIGNFTLQGKKQFSIGSTRYNIHPINQTTTKISGHTNPFHDVLVEYNNTSKIANSDSNGLFELELTESIIDNTEIKFICNGPNSFIYETRKIKTPYNGELNLLDADLSLSFDLSPISYNPVILPKKNILLLRIVDSRIDSSDWKLYAYIDKKLTSQNGYYLENALIYRTFDNKDIILDNTPKLVFTGTNNNGSPLLKELTLSQEKGPLLDLSNNTLEVNEEYFANINFLIEE